MTVARLCRLPTVVVVCGLCLIVFVLGAIASAEDAPDAPTPLEVANRLSLRGKYAEAAEMYAAMEDQALPAVIVGQARCQLAVGRYDEAVKLLQDAVKNQPEDVALVALFAEVELARGNADAARAAVGKAIAKHPDDVRLRYFLAEAERAKQGYSEALEKQYEWFIDHYNASYKNIEDPEELRCIGLAVAQHARWTQNHDQFSFLVNELYPDALELEESYWQAHYESARLFLEKFNEAEAFKSLQVALRINANSADVHAALAEFHLQKADLDKAKAAIDRARSINPQHLHARQLAADLEFATFEPAKAIPVLEETLSLWPHAKSIKGRLAAARGCVEGLKKPITESKMGAMLPQGDALNSIAGEFFEAMGDSFDILRHYPEAAQYYAEAMRLSPRRVSLPGKLGWVYMRLGEEDKARELFKRAMEINFGNARIKNGVEVLEVLDGYKTLETDHFLIRYDAAKDQLLAEYVARHLEEMYPVICKRLNYFPKEKSLFELFNRAKNTSGHGWFSARMVGLPHIHTIGACGGQMVAMVSPGAIKQKFNWARVVEHEFVHMVNLQQTNFNIPHWYTEALAVLGEGYPRSTTWNEMLARRVPAGKVFNLDTINQGFIRPTSSEDWQMAYCQAEMYAEYLLERFGEDSLGKMLTGYADNLNTPATIKREFGVEVDDFEAGYTAFVQRIVDAIPVAKKASSRKFPELLEHVEEHPDDAVATAELALAYLNRKAYPQAGELARQALELDAKSQGAVYVQLRLRMLIGETENLDEKIEAALDLENPHPRLLRLLAKRKYEGRKFAEAAELYQVGKEKFAGDDIWNKLLGRVYQKLGDDEKLLAVLEDMATADADNWQFPLRIAKIYHDREEYEEAAMWANRVLHVDVMNVDAHYLFARASAKTENFEVAEREYRAAVQIAPDKLEVRLALAKLLVQTGKEDEAREVLEQLLKQAPGQEDALELMEQLGEPAAAE